MNIRELLEFILSDRKDESALTLSHWISESRRFHTFVDSNRSKIRKKLRTARTAESLRSVLLELEVARHFVADRRCLVEYERYGQGTVRSPDLTVTFRGKVVNLEVTRIQIPSGEASDWEGKLINLVCYKLGQMLPECANLLVVATETGSLSIDEVAKAMKRLKERVEERDGDLLKRFGFGGDPSGFFKQFQWLSGILVWNTHGGESVRGLWENPQARRSLSSAGVSLMLGLRI